VAWRRLFQEGSNKEVLNVKGSVDVAASVKVVLRQQSHSFLFGDNSDLGL
jgi:hypothetical protein